MELSLTVLNQVLVMFVLIIIGYIGFKTKLVDETGNRQLTNVLLYIIAPLVIIDAYQMEYNETLASNLLIAFALGLASHIIAIAVSYILIKKKGNEKKAPIERFAIIYSNCGFMALPLVSALFGAEGVFYASAYMTIFNLLTWTHGYIMMSGKADKNTIKSAFLSPVILSVGVGLLIFFLKIPLPSVLKTSVYYMASVNTPLAMIVTGVSLAQTNILSAFKQIRCYYIMFLSCLLVPFIAMCIYLFLPLPTNLVLVNLVSTACPCAVTTILFSTKFELDSSYASKILTLSNVTSIITIPAVVFMYQFLSTLV
ncbi:MAG: AEC family transporter [Oscillospiraceae bacterium]